jgi:ArsR family transcriptional regulator, lead/cadmium/zinc/bismuth-responsive transcriptional repressor
MTRKTAASSAHAECGPDEHDRRISKDAPVTEEAFERAASIFRAAGDISRLKLLARLAHGEWCVTELADAAGVGLSTVSQQLRLLRAEKLVSRRRVGKHIYYALADGHILDLVQSALAHASEPAPSPPRTTRKEPLP